MTLTHKIKLIFARLNWWLRLTENARDRHRTLKDYLYLTDLYKKKHSEFIEAEKQILNSEQTYKLKGQVELLASILDIKE